MKRDKSVIASMLGAASTLAGEAVSLLLVRLGVGILTFTALTASLSQ